MFDRHLYDPEADSAALPEQFDFVTRADAEAMALRAFWRGFATPLACAALGALMALGAWVAG